MGRNIASLAREYFDPYRRRSGTELMAPLLHSMIRMTRPRSVVECGAGYTTLFILDALDENAADFDVEKTALVDKTERLKVLECEPDIASWQDPDFVRWFGYQGRASTADPSYYLTPYEPRLYCFERLSGDHDYVKKITRAAEAAGLAERLSLLDGAQVEPGRLPPEARPVDMVWWDAGTYEDGFELFWPLLRPDGGIMIFHNVASGVMRNWEDFQQSLAADERVDVEVMVLPQPNKLDQNSCAIVRKTDGYRPPHEQAQPARQLEAVKRLCGRTEP